MSKDDGIAEVVSKEERKRLKKLTKEQAKKKAKAEEAGSAAVDESQVKEKKDKKEKKKDKKKKEKSTSEDVGDEAMVVDSTEPEPSKKEKKKRKRETEEPSESKDPSSSSKKDKKKRRNDDDASPSSAPTASSSTPFSLSSPTTPTAAEEFLARHSITITLPGTSTNAKPILPIVNFDQLSNLPERLRKEAFKGFKEPSPIQACTWPPALEGKDVVGIAETGSGKTLAFGIPALMRLISSPSSSGIATLVVAPTRELALQTHDTLSALGKAFGIASVAVFGGVPKDAQIKMLKASLRKNVGQDSLLTRIVVGTPGRILDLMQDGALDLSGVEYLVLDEADRMLDKGFENDIRRIIGAAKPIEERQTMMFSATWPDAVRRLASTFQRDPVRVTVGSDDLTANSRVEQIVEVFDDSRSKDQRLLTHLRALFPQKPPNPKSKSSHLSTSSTSTCSTSPPEITRILVFALYKKEASRVEDMLKHQSYTVGALHGDMSQPARIDALENFKTGRTQVLVATDVAARGLDIPNVGAVVNYTFPLTIEDYIHRIGRTGRGGKSGKSITFFTGDNHERALAGELARVLSDSGFDNAALREKFPMTIKKKEHSVYGAFFRDDIPPSKGPQKITF